MTLDEKQAAWCERYLLIPDVQDRLAAVVSRRSRLEPLRDGERVDANLVPGCLSRVWLAVERENGILRVRLDAEAGIVKGLAALLAELYDGAASPAAAAFETTLLDELGIGRLLSPTRANGLGKIIERIRARAAEA